MKILHIINTAHPNSGGPIECIRQFDRVWREAGLIDSTIATLDTDCEISDKGWVVPLGRVRTDAVAGGNRLLQRYGVSKLYDSWLRANARAFDAAIVHGLWNYSTFAATRFFSEYRMPYFVFTHGMMDPWFKQKYPIKHVAKQMFWLFNEGILLSHSRSVLFTCEEERLSAEGVFLGHKNYRSAIVGLGTSPAPEYSLSQVVAFEKSVPKLNGRKFFLYLSRIHPKKGCDMLISAFANSLSEGHKLDLVIAGPDEDGWRFELECQVAKLKIGERVHFSGPLFGEAKWGAFRKADAFILPSHQENFGIVVTEALSCGVPVLISNKVNIWREIIDAKAGYARPNTLGGTSNLINDWLQTSEGERALMKSRALDLFAQRYDVRAAAVGAYDVIKGML